MTRKKQQSRRTAAAARQPSTTQPAGRKTKQVPTQKAAGIPKSVKTNDAIISQICGLTDPFCKHAVGGKYPDDSSVRTLPWGYHTRFVMSSDVGGNLAYLFAPNYNYQPYLLGAPTTATQASFSTYLAGAPIADTSAFRIVSWGFKLTRVIAPLNASGMVHVRVLGVENGAGLGSLDTASYARSESYDGAVQDCRGLAVIGTRTSQMPQKFYFPADVTPTNSILTWDAAGWCPVSVSVTGAPASVAVLEAEVWVNYELTFDESSSMGLFATPPPVANAIVTGSASKISSSVKSVHSDMDAVSNVIRKAAITATSGLVGGPAGAFMSAMLM